MQQTDVSTVVQSNLFCSNPNAVKTRVPNCSKICL